jgi:hypothetical protein
MVVALAVIIAGAGAVMIGEAALGAPRAVLEERRRKDLRRRAPHDRRAAKELLERLREDLAREAAVRRDIERDGSANSRGGKLLHDIEQAERATRDEITQIEMWIGILH